MTDSEALAVIMSVEASISSLPELPGYNGSLLAIDDISAERIAFCLTEARAHIAEALRDAARWRWLRENNGEMVRSAHIQDMWANCKGNYPTRDEWDAAIDAAMKEEDHE